jgi:hypothetical protein
VAGDGEAEEVESAGVLAELALARLGNMKDWTVISDDHGTCKLANECVVNAFEISDPERRISGLAVMFAVSR